MFVPRSAFNLAIKKYRIPTQLAILVSALTISQYTYHCQNSDGSKDILLFKADFRYRTESSMTCLNKYHCDLNNLIIFFTYLPCILKIIKVFSPTDAQLDSLKNNFKFALKLTLKGSYVFRCEKHHSQGAHYCVLSDDGVFHAETCSSLSILNVLAPTTVGARINP